MVLCMEGEVGWLALTGAYKHYLSHSIPLFLHYGLLIEALLVFQFLQQIATLTFHKQVINFKHLISFADLLLGGPPVFLHCSFVHEASSQTSCICEGFFLYVPRCTCTSV